jgi:hypothetical protein
VIPVSRSRDLKRVRIEAGEADRQPSNEPRITANKGQQAIAASPLRGHGGLSLKASRADVGVALEARGAAPKTVKVVPPPWKPEWV